MLLLRRAVAGHLTRVRPRTRRLSALSGWAALLASIGACGGAEPRIPTTLSLNSLAVSFTALGQTQQLLAAVTDQDGNSVSGADVSWSSSNTGVASVSPTGVVTAVGVGSADVTATSGSAAAVAQVAVVQTPTELQKVSGDGQTATPGQTLASPFVVQVNDALGHPVPGATVIFTVTQGGGSVGTPTAATTADGRASTTFTAGTTGGSPQVSATIATTTIIVSFTVTTTSSFNIELRFLSTPTTTQREAFTDAERRWEELVVGDLSNIPLSVPAETCPAVNETIDDVLIFVSLEPIDGPDGTLARAGPCFIRTSNDLTILGRMGFDIDDLDAMESAGVLTEVILHEMGHVLGFGTLWTRQGLLADASLSGGTDPHFTGAQAINAFDDVGGSLYAGGNKVPVEDTGGEGLADGHWRESVLGSELMTGDLDLTEELSIVTVASLADQGYTVNLSAADPYTLSLSLRATAAAPRFHLGNDILHGPIKRVDASGRVVGELR